MNDRRAFFNQRASIYRQDINAFADEVLRFEPDEWQKDVFADMTGYSKVAIRSGQGVGKTGLEAVVLLWFICCFPYARVVATAPTKQQLNDVLWAEVDKWMGNSPLLNDILKWTKTRVYMKKYEKRWFAVARTATKPENMQGFHEKNMLFIVDEASGVADPIMEAILGTLSGENNKLLMCGNPTRTSGTFYDAFHADVKMYKVHKVSSMDSPRTNKENIDSLIRKYGKDSNVVRVRVNGDFPKQEDDVFMPLEWIERSVGSEVSNDTLKGMGAYIDENGQKIHEPENIWLASIGCDVARFGNDKTVISYRINERVDIYKKYNGKDTVWTASNVARLYLNIKNDYKFMGKVAVNIDDGGVGGGVVDQLRALVRTEPKVYGDMVIVPVNFGQPIPKHRYVYDTTTYMMSVVKDLIAPFDDNGNPHACELVLPNDNDVIGQFSCRKFDFASNQKLRVESKKTMKDRGISSPDEADSILLACMPVHFKKDKKGDRR